MSEQEENVESEKLAEDIRQIKEMGSVTLPDAKHVIHCLNIIGQVEGHYILPAQNKTTKYEHIIPALVAIEQDRSIEGLVIILNTVGGDVEAGLAIADCVNGCGRRSLHRRAVGGVCEKVIYSAKRHNDHTPC